MASEAIQNITRDPGLLRANAFAMWTGFRGAVDTIPDIGISAFSLFFLTVLAQGRGQSNCERLFGMSAVPSRQSRLPMLDGTDLAAFDRTLYATLGMLRENGALENFWHLGGRLPMALDGSEPFASRKIHCASCSSRRVFERAWYQAEIVEWED